MGTFFIGRVKKMTALSKLPLSGPLTKMSKKPLISAKIQGED